MRTLSPTDRDLAHYEGLVLMTAARYVDMIDGDIEDLQQLLRIRVWKALNAFDPAKSVVPRVRGRRSPRERFVFMVLRNECKDWVRWKRLRGNLSIERLEEMDTEGGTPVSRELEQTLSTSSDVVYSEVEDELPLIPSTLNELELQVVCLLYRDYRQTEIALKLMVEKREVERAVRGIRAKMADWRPSAPLPEMAEAA